MSERIRKPLRRGIIAAIVTFSVIAGTVGSYAYWSATSQATLGTGAASLTSTASGWNPTVLGNEDVSATGSIALTTTGSITFTNTTSTTSSQSQNLSAVFSAAAGSDATLAAGTTLTAWYVASAATCTAAAVPASPVTGTWAAGVTVTRPLAPGASASFCLRNTIADRQTVDDTDGTRSFTPQAVATLSINNFTAASTTTSSIATEYIFPMQAISAGNWNYIKRATTEWCWDVSGSGTTAGSLLISYACKNNTDINQDFRFMDTDGDGYGDFQARHATNLRVAAAASTTSGTAVNMQTTNAADATQQWQVQLVSASTYQFVNKYSGLCLSAPAVSAGAMTQVTCSGAADQKFTFTQRAVVPLLTFTCTDTGATNGRTAQYAWTSDYSGGPYKIQARQTAAAAWVDLVTGATTTATVPAPIGTPLTTWGTGTYTVQIVNAAGATVGTGQIRVLAQYSGFIFQTFDYYYARC